MTMHIEGPWLTTTGKRKSKQKFRNAEQAKQAREQAEAWAQLKAKYEPKTSKNTTKTQQALAITKPVPYRRETKHIPSLGISGSGTCSRPDSKVYTGTAMLGIATMHKSNSVPVFSQEDAVEISRMRRG